MLRTAVPVFALIALAFTSTPARAQFTAGDSLPLLAGARVRVTAPPLGPQPGVFRFAGLRNDTLLLRPPKGASVDTTAIPLGAVARIETSRGWRRRALSGAAVGLVAGATLGALLGHAAWDEPDPFCERNCGPRTRRQSAVQVGISGAQAGAALGALVGRFVMGERWESVATPAPR